MEKWKMENRNWKNGLMECSQDKIKNGKWELEKRKIGMELGGNGKMENWNAVRRKWKNGRMKCS